MSKQVRVRFAPSPTGYLHVGSARTALFNWLFARHSNGVFILRIEDTDRVRSKKEFLDEILDSLKWLGLTWDEGPFFQAERLSLYQEEARKLLEKGLAEEVEEEGRKALRFKVPQERVRIDDAVHGPIEFDNALLSDFVILKSDGFPAYNFACVVDDAAMGITHVIRGDDHISNTPKQLALYKAFGYPIPQFAHIPLILGSDRSRLSKRHGATSIADYRAQGFLPENLVNFLTLLGWSPKDGREILDVQATIQEFTLERINKTAAVFDVEKLAWMNSQYWRSLSPERLMPLVEPHFKSRGILLGPSDRENLGRVLELYRERVRIPEDLVEQAGYFFTETVSYDEKVGGEILKKAGVAEKLSALRGKFEALAVFNAAETEGALRALANDLGVKAAELIHPARYAVSGRTVGPGLFITLEALGEEKVLKRLEEAIEWAQS